MCERAEHKRIHSGTSGAPEAVCTLAMSSLTPLPMTVAGSVRWFEGTCRPKPVQTRQFRQRSFAAAYGLGPIPSRRVRAALWRRLLRPAPLSSPLQSTQEVVVLLLRFRTRTQRAAACALHKRYNITCFRFFRRMAETLKIWQTRTILMSLPSSCS